VRSVDSLARSEIERRVHHQTIDRVWELTGEQLRDFNVGECWLRVLVPVRTEIRLDLGFSIRAQLRETLS